MSEAIVKNFLEQGESVVITMDDYLEEIRNWIPHITIISKTNCRIYFRVTGEGLHGFSGSSKRGWAKVHNISIEIEVPMSKISGFWNRLKFLLESQRNVS